MATASIMVFPQIILRNRGFSMTLIGAVTAVGQIASILMPLLVGAIASRVQKDGKVIFCCITAVVLLWLPVTHGKSDIVAIICFVFAMGLMCCCTPMVDGYMTKFFRGDSEKYSSVRSLGSLAYVLTLTATAVFHYPNNTDNTQIMMLIAITGGLMAYGSLLVPDLKEEGDIEVEKGFKLRGFDKKFYTVMLVVGIAKISSVVIEKFLSTYMTDVMKFGSSFASFTALGSFCEIFAMRISGKLLRKKKISYYDLLLVSFIGHIVRFSIYRYTNSLVFFLIGQTMHAFTFGTFHTGVMAFIGNHVPKKKFSQATTFYWALAVNLPQTIGSVTGGWVIDNLGYNGLFSIFTLFPIIAIVIMLINRRMLTTEV